VLLTVHKLFSAYGGLVALRDVNLTVGEGELVCVIGRNGAGKSTLLRAISGVQPVLSGSIKLHETEITRASSTRRVANGIVQVPEGRQVFADLSVDDNLRLGAFRHRRGMADRLEQAFVLFPQLKERRHSLAGSLSGGQQQMLVLGRALMAEPRLLMLDEPSMGLAPQVVAQIFRTIEHLKRSGTTILLVEQNAAAALMLADRGYVLETGQVVLTGHGRDLLQDARIRSAYLGQ